MTITEMVQEAHKTAVEHGFWDDVLKFDELNDVLDSDEYEQYIKKVIGCCLMLITSELAEALKNYGIVIKEILLLN